MSTLTAGSLHIKESPSKVPVALYLPRELVDIIVDYIRPVAGDLRSLALVARVFTHPCQAALFQTVVLQPPGFVKEDKVYTGPDTALRFGNLIAERPHLAELVKTLVYCFTFDYRSRSHRTEITEKSSELITALSKLNNVTELQLEASEGVKSEWGDREVEAIPVIPCGYSTALGKELLGIMQRGTTKSLTLRNIRISIKEMARIIGIDTLHLDGSVLMCKGDWRYRGKRVIGVPIYIKHLVYRGKYGINDFVLDPEEEAALSGRFNVRWDELETLSLPIEARHWKQSELPDIIMSTTRRLKKLSMHTMNAFHPGENDDTENIPHACPMIGLHEESCNTLTHILFLIEFDLMWAYDGELIKDPYHGLLLGGVIQKCINLEDLSVQVLIGGSKWRCMIPESAGAQWGELDKVLAPKEKECPYPRLRKVVLQVGNKGVCDEQDDDLHRPHFQRMLDTCFVGLRGLERERGLELTLEVVNVRDDGSECDSDSESASDSGESSGE